MIPVLISAFLFSAGNAGYLPADTKSFYISGDYSALVQVKGKLYAATGYGIAQLDDGLSSALNIPTPEFSSLIVASGERVWLASGENVREFSVKDSLRETAFFSPGGQVSALAASGKHLAAATNSGILVISSQSDPSKPLSTENLGAAAEDIVFSGDFLYALTRNGIKIFDCTNTPVLAGEINLAGAKTLAAGSGKLFVGLGESSIVVFSVKDPAHPMEELRFDAGATAVSLTCSGKTLYAALGSQGYAVFDFRGKRLDTPLSFREGYISDIVPARNGVYLALGGKGIALLEGSKPSAFAVSKRFSRSSPVLHTSRSGDFWAIAQGGGGVSIVKQDADSLVTGYADPRPENALGVLLSGTNLYIADGERGVSIYSIKTFPGAERKYELFQPGEPLRFGLTGELIVVAEGGKGLRTLWICPCGPLKDKGKVEGIKALDVAVTDSIAYVADPDSGLRIIALREEGKTPEEISIYPGAVSPVALLLDGQRLFVADSMGLLMILDVSNPVAPRQLSFTPIGVRPYGLALTGTTLYIASGERGVLEVGVQDPTAPVLGNFIDTPGKALAVAASESHLAVADYTSWLLIPLASLK